MLVEFIGSTGAGKTTVLRSVQCHLATKAATTISAELVTGLVGMEGVTHQTVQNLVQEVVGLPFFVSSLYRHRGFVESTVRLLLREARSSVITICNLRSLERKLGGYTLIRRIAGDRIILIDEGPVLAAHMFVYAGHRVSPRDIGTFAATVPLPDLIVYVRAPVDAVVRRTLLRQDPPRAMASRFRPDLVRYAEAAADLFEQLVALLRPVVPVLVVDNPDMDEERREVVADAIAGSVINHRLKVDRRPNPALIGGAPLGVGQHGTDAR